MDCFAVRAYEQKTIARVKEFGFFQSLFSPLLNYSLRIRASWKWEEYRA
jgi:hypothetical protein